jgi:hypothetical protein
LLRVFQGPLPQSDGDLAWAQARRAVDDAANQGIVLALEDLAPANAHDVPFAKLLLIWAINLRPRVVRLDAAA